jgi:exopolysaccharide biosynthesis polyprenyl glycosylphosphotransferase
MFACAACKERLRPAFEKFRTNQLREGSLYTDLRAFIPVPALFAVWLGVVHQSFSYPIEISHLLSRPVTVRHLLIATAIVGIWNVGLSLSHYSRRSIRADVFAEVSRLLSLSLVCGLLPLLVHSEGGTLGLGLFLAILTTSSIFLAAFALLGSFLAGAALSPLLGRSRITLIVGSGHTADELRQLLQFQYAQFQIFGCVDDEYRGANLAADNYLGKIDSLPQLLKSHPIEMVLIGLPIRSNYDDIQRVIGICDQVGVESRYMLNIFETSHARFEVHSPRRFSIVNKLTRDPKRHLKRVFDFLLASVFLVLFSPIFLAAAIAVWLSSSGPIFFVQQRYGLNRKRFPMFKFRSMVVDAEQRQAALESKNEAQGPVFKLKSDPRVTRVGAFLRRTSIDELPQLFNVLRGEMSIVGPRPLPIRDVTRFEESWLLRRFSVKPGLTCLWQVNGRSDSSFDFWIRQDLAYIDKWSLMLDVKILLMTIPAVLKGKGAV